MIVDLERSSFPSLARPKRAKWAPVFLSPIRGSQERLVIGVAVFDDTGFHIEAANALSRFQCLYGSQADIVIQVAGIALDELKADFAMRSAEAITDFRASISGISIGGLENAEGESLQAIGASWMGALSSLYDVNASDMASTLDDGEDSFERAFEALATGDRLPQLVLEYVVEERVGLASFFRADLLGKQRRRRNHEISIDFSGSRLVANFGTLRVGQLGKSVDLIKRRLWDLKVDRDSEPSVVFRRDHEMLIQMPALGDPQVSEKQYENLETARLALEKQADQEELRLQAFTDVEAIGNRVLKAEEA